MLIACPSCQRQRDVDHAAGKQVRCPAPGCGSIFVVPVAPAAPPPKPVAAPRPVAPRPVAPPPRSDAPFAFGDGGVAGPAAEFGFTESTDGGLSGIRMRTRRARAAGWLNLAASTMMLFTLVVIALEATLCIMNHAWLALAGAACPSLLLLVFPVLILVGARMVAQGRRWGLALTAAIASLTIGALTLLNMLGIGGWSLFIGYEMAMHGTHGRQVALLSTCGVAVLSALTTFTSLYAGFIALRTLMNAEVKATFT